MKNNFLKYTILFSFLCVIIGLAINFYSSKKVINLDSNYDRKIDSLYFENKLLKDSINKRELFIISLYKLNDSLTIKNDNLELFRKNTLSKIKKYENYTSPNYKSSIDTMQAIFSEAGI